MVKGKAIPLQAWRGPESYRQSAHECGKVVSPTHRPGKNSWYLFLLGTTVAQCLRFCATNRKVAGSIPDGVVGNCH